MSEKKKKLDKHILRQVLNETNGKITEAKDILFQAGYNVTSIFAVKEMIKGDPALQALVDNPAPVKGEAPSVEDVAVRAKPPAADIISIDQQENALNKSMEDCGFSSEEAQQMSNYSDFIKIGFERTVDATYGIMVHGVMKLQKRAEWIEDNILCKTDYEDAEAQLLWQKEYTSIMQQIGKYADITNNAALIRVKAHAVANGGRTDRRKKTLKSLKPSPSESVEVV
jgi:hypothetical protein